MAKAFKCFKLVYNKLCENKSIDRHKYTHYNFLHSFTIKRKLSVFSSDLNTNYYSMFDRSPDGVPVVSKGVRAPGESQRVGSVTPLRCFGVAGGYVNVNVTSMVDGYNGGLNACFPPYSKRNTY